MGTAARAGLGEPGTAVAVINLPPHSEQNFAPSALLEPHEGHRGGGSAAPH
jgi:hypothetical protein